MAIWQSGSKKTLTGKTLKRLRTKRKFELGREAILTKMGKDKQKVQRTKGGNTKLKLRSAEWANVLDKKTKKTQKLKITNVVENPASPHFTRENIITRGAIIEVDGSKARVTSRPGQHGIINAVKIE